MENNESLDLRKPQDKPAPKAKGLKGALEKFRPFDGMLAKKAASLLPKNKAEESAPLQQIPVMSRPVEVAPEEPEEIEEEVEIARKTRTRKINSGKKSKKSKKAKISSKKKAKNSKKAKGGKKSSPKIIIKRRAAKKAADDSYSAPEKFIQVPVKRSFQEILADKISQPETVPAAVSPVIASAEAPSAMPLKETKINPDEANSAFRKNILRNGLQFIAAPVKGTKTITILLIFGTGSKYESRAQNGLSHFLEHMFFKGTEKRRNTLALSSDLDALGSEYNAFTTKEYTGYWIKVDSSRAEEAMDILSDMLLNSKFSAAEIEREKGVIIEEMNMYHENPRMYIEDLFEQCLYGDSPAGREIVGTKENIKNFKRKNFIDYFESQYGANAAVLCLAGNVDERAEKMAAKFFGQMKKANFKDKLKTAEAQSAPAVKTYYKEGDQANISLGVRAYANNHPDKIALKVLSVVLGGSMSSRMFTEVRERRGLAYSVHTNVECYTDTGYLTTEAGIPVGKEEEAIKTILAEYKKITKQLVPKDELRRAKDLIKGRAIIGLESSDDTATWYARQAILKEQIFAPEEFFLKLEKVTAEDLRRIALDIFKNEKLNLAVIGPFKGVTQFEQFLKIF